MSRNRQLWLIALIIFLLSAVYQRMTGPTHPVSGSVEFLAESIAYRFERTHGGPSNHQVKIEVGNPEITGTLSYKRFKTDDPWTDLPLRREGKNLIGELPHQPAAGKLEYRVKLQAEDKWVIVPADRAVIIRFKGAVPLPVLIVHIIFMALAMILSNRAGLEALTRRGDPRKFVFWTIVTLFLGGLILGPIVQKYAFGAYWTGWPWGHDLTDNKTVVAFIFWLVAFIAGRKGRRARGWVLAAALVTLAVYLIPHSVLGSELDYSKM